MFIMNERDEEIKEASGYFKFVWRLAVIMCICMCVIVCETP